MTFDRDEFSTFQPMRDGLGVFVASGDCLPIRDTGSISVTLESDKTAIVNYVLYIPGLDRKLLSISLLAERRAEAQFIEEQCTKVEGLPMVNVLKSCMC
ncbi:hypothetical protein CCR75_001418 [Bremia lactucae]|uniref:Retrovirus-related Pol polyprotein from transposon TNT 1-94-like beta-barrel domain-containing protein n=1 Tax=Bremia lactucae TaxID=4779 RepID=A0A976FKA3_BRELC|nr:hypothetical protein CCR75_001418 [Bremia lactucae]